MSFYFMQADENGVECVDQIEVSDQRDANEALVTRLAESYPEVIYFEVPLHHDDEVFIDADSVVDIDGVQVSGSAFLDATITNPPPIY